MFYRIGQRNPPLSILMFRGSYATDKNEGKVLIAWKQTRLHGIARYMQSYTAQVCMSPVRGFGTPALAQVHSLSQVCSREESETVYALSGSKTLSRLRV